VFMIFDSTSGCTSTKRSILRVCRQRSAFHIGSYQIAQKWLKDGKGRTLSAAMNQCWGKSAIWLRFRQGAMSSRPRHDFVGLPGHTPSRSLSLKAGQALRADGRLVCGVINLLKIRGTSLVHLSFKYCSNPCSNVSSDRSPDVHHVVQMSAPSVSSIVYLKEAQNGEVISEEKGRHSQAVSIWLIL